MGTATVAMLRHCVVVAVCLVHGVAAFVHPFPPDPPKQVSAQEHCEICRAVMEQVPLKLGKKKWDNVNVVDAMENICNGENYMRYAFAPPTMVAACKKLIDGREEILEDAFMAIGSKAAYDADPKGHSDKICIEQVGLCANLDESPEAKKKPPSIFFDGKPQDLDQDQGGGYRVKTEAEKEAEESNAGSKDAGIKAAEGAPLSGSKKSGDGVKAATGPPLRKASGGVEAVEGVDLAKEAAGADKVRPSRDRAPTVPHDPNNPIDLTPPGKNKKPIKKKKKKGSGKKKKGAASKDAGTCNTPDLSSFLADVGLASYQAKLADDLGARDTSDLTLLDEPMLQSVGMKPLEAKRLLKRVQNPVCQS